MLLGPFTGAHENSSPDPSIRICWGGSVGQGPETKPKSKEGIRVSDDEVNVIEA
jgi:hypothetical protein